jgi:histone-lysine N-methyltransferase SETMAR
MQNSKEHIRHCLLYEYQLRHSAIEATRNICQAIGSDVISTATAYRWYERFANGDYSLEDEPKSGRSHVINLDDLEKALKDDPTLTTRNMASKLGCSNATVYYRYKDLRLVSKLGEWVPHDLNQSQLKKRVKACQELLDKSRKSNWLNNIITGDEKWVVYANVSRKRQWLAPGQKAKPTPKAGLHPEKRMLCVWWSVTGVVHWELLPVNTTVTAARYCAQIQRMAAELEKKHPQRGQIYFQHDNARPHVANLVKAKLERLGWELLPHPPYSPDLAPSDYHLFRSLSNDLRGRKFKNETELKQYLQSFFDSKPATFYASGIRDLPRRWQEVIDTQGKYITKK